MCTISSIAIMCCAYVADLKKNKIKNKKKADLESLSFMFNIVALIKFAN